MTKNLKEFTNLERRARRAIKTTAEGRLINRKFAETERLLAAGKISKRQASCMNKCLRVVRKLDVLRWVYESLRRDPNPAAN